ncbi:hypothetical protein [Microbacterium thalassium]|uniref:Glycosyltransferase RgtA/B/C/D-like domain-containing protein n=1 Tax=Microbacterium thalassium TaxID=362649 RepID=A0A7X0KTF9_9MICO|nr:hypothetical protein [Microbacterium thalassium]MBB6390047.1 hypothetical protein [Microbacterium thalassium]GLK24703.1 hypothetical protein GCM10017607_20210 [Microbacterium thalassium]
MITQLWTALMLSIAVVGAGAPLARWTARGLGLPTATRVALIPLTGLTFVGVATLIAGHLHVLGPWLPYGLAAGGAVLALIGFRENAAPVAQGWAGVVRHVRSHPVALIATSLALVLALVCTAAAPFRIDEIEYHWAAPVAWAEFGGWNDSPFKHVDGYPLMEIIYTAAATQGSYVAAHLLHFISFLALGFALAGLAGSLGVRGTGVTAAAGLAMPVVWDSSYVAYNDVPVAATTIAAAAVVMGSRKRRVQAAWLAGGLIAVGVSIKPNGIVGVGVVGLMMLMRYFFERRDAAASAAGTPAPRFSSLVREGLVLIVLPLAALAFWLVRRYAITGVFLAADGTPSGEALARLPSPLQQALAPLLPFAGSIIGGSEPWGGRLGVVLLLLIPAIAYAIWRRGDVLRRFSLAIVPAFAHWIVLGLRIVRTRFHIAAWGLMVIAVRIPLEDAMVRRPRLRFWLEAGWTLCILVGLADVSIEMVKRIATLIPLG